MAILEVFTIHDAAMFLSHSCHQQAVFNSSLRCSSAMRLCASECRTRLPSMSCYVPPCSMTHPLPPSFSLFSIVSLPPSSWCLVAPSLRHCTEILSPQQTAMPCLYAVFGKHNDLLTCTKQQYNWCIDPIYSTDTRQFLDNIGLVSSFWPSASHFVDQNQTPRCRKATTCHICLCFFIFWPTRSMLPPCAGEGYVSGPSTVFIVALRT